MEVNLSPALHAQVEEWAAKTGRNAGDLITEAMAGYLEEIDRTREMLNSRYDSVRNGDVSLIDGEEAFSQLKERTEAQRRHT